MNEQDKNDPEETPVEKHTDEEKRKVAHIRRIRNNEQRKCGKSGLIVKFTNLSVT